MVTRQPLRSPRYRWECDCSEPPVLLARYEPGQFVQVKVRDRGFVVLGGVVVAQCPKCGRCHTGPPDGVN